MKRILPLRPPTDQSPRYIGLDLGKKETQLALVDATGKPVVSRRLPTTRRTFSQLASELTQHDQVAMEVTTNAFAIARLLMSSPARITISDPIKTRLIAESKVSTDKIDAKVLAQLDRSDFLPPVWLPDPDTQQLRQLMSDRQSLVDRRTELKNRVHAVLHRNLVDYSFGDLFGVTGTSHLQQLSQDSNPDPNVDPLERLRLREMRQDIVSLNTRIEETESVIAAFIVARPYLLAAVDILMSIGGVSLVVAAGVVAAVGDVTRFRHPKKLASYFGLVPSTSQTGKLKFYHGRITKRGRAQARWLLIEAAEHLVKSPGPMRAFYARIARKRNHNVAIVAVARRLAELVWHLLTKKQDYFYSIPRLTDEKRARLRQFAATQKTKTAPVPRSPLYATGLQGRKIKTDIARQAALHAERLYADLVATRKPADSGRTPLLDFDPTRPTPVDWQKVLEHFAEAHGKAVRLQTSTGSPKRHREASQSARSATNNRPEPSSS